MAVQHDAGSAGPAPAKAPGPLHRAWTMLYEIKTSTVFFLVAASLGLGLVGAQVETEAVVVIFAVFWGITVIAMVAWLARWATTRSAGQGRHRRAAHS